MQLRCWCGGADLQPFSPDYARCAACETLVCAQPPAPGPVGDAARDFYGRDYWFAHQEQDLRLPNVVARARSDLSERAPYWLAVALRYRLPPGRALEIGCGHGGFVALLQQAGFDAAGTELSPWVVEFAKRTFAIPVHEGTLERLPLEPATLDFIFAFDVWEHLPDPVGATQAAVRLLKSDGVLVLQTPGYPEGASLAALEHDRRRFRDMLLPREHVHLFSRTALTRLLGQCGLPQVAFEPAFCAHQNDNLFAFAGRDPLKPRPLEEVYAALEASPGARLVRAILELHQRLAESEADRAARLVLLNRSEQDLKMLSAEVNRLRIPWALRWLRPPIAPGPKRDAPR